MPAYKQDVRVKRLMQEVGWVGSVEQFSEQLRIFIQRLPEPYLTTMWRYYVQDEIPERDEITGRLKGKEQFFYQETQSGRAALKTVFALTLDDLDRLRDLKREGVC